MQWVEEGENALDNRVLRIGYFGLLLRLRERLIGLQNSYYQNYVSYFWRIWTVGKIKFKSLLIWQYVDWSKKRILISIFFINKIKASVFFGDENQLNGKKFLYLNKNYLNYTNISKRAWCFLFELFIFFTKIIIILMKKDSHVSFFLRKVSLQHIEQGFLLESFCPNIL